MNKRVTVITPTTGTRYLQQNLESVAAQTYGNLTHLVVSDGPDNEDRIGNRVKSFDRTTFLALPHNTGHSGYNGHRIYGAMSYLAEADYVCFLDEDNWLEPNHVEDLIKVTEKYDWAFSFRKIVDSEGNYICNDDCESLGLWPTCISEQEYFLDTGCYFLPTKIAVQISSAWYRRARHPDDQPEMDRLIMHYLRQYNFTYNGSMEYSLNYRVGNRSDSVKAEFFLRGNEILKQKYPAGYPWQINKR